MKNIAFISACVITVLSFGGCGFIDAFKEGFKAGVQQAIKENEGSYSTEQTYIPVETKRTDTATQTQTCTVDNITFEVNGNLKKMDGYDGAFVSQDNKSVYVLQGTSMLGSYTPNEFLTELVNIYSQSNEITYKDSSMTELITADGTECYVGRIEIVDSDGVAHFIDVLTAPDKNMAVTYAAQCAEGSAPDMDIRTITATTKFNIGTEDILTGKHLSLSDGTELHLENDGSFKYYQYASDPNSAYMTGTYEAYYGQEAFDKLVSMTEYGLTEEELENTLSANMNGYSIGGSSPYDYFDTEDSNKESYHICKDTFYALIVNADTLHENGTETPAEGDIVLHIGYYIPELETFDMLNANSYEYFQWSIIQ